MSEDTPRCQYCDSVLTDPLSQRYCSKECRIADKRGYENSDADSARQNGEHHIPTYPTPEPQQWHE